MKIRKGDKIRIVTGKDKGKEGSVLKAMPKENKILVLGINMKKRHQKPKRSNSKGQIIDIPAFFDVSNAMLIDPSSGKSTRISIKENNGKYIRISKKSGAEIK